MKITQLAVIVAALALASSGCKKTPPNSNPQKEVPVAINEDEFYFNDATLSHSEVREHWLITLSEKNPRLYFEVIKAFLTSKKSGKMVYILREDYEGQNFYRSSFESGHGKDVISINNANKEIRFDHFNNGDGPSFMESAETIWFNKRIREINKEVDFKRF